MFLLPARETSTLGIILSHGDIRHEMKSVKHVAGQFTIFTVHEKHNTFPLTGDVSQYDVIEYCSKFMFRVQSDIFLFMFFF